jgi:hypothetical protein
MFVICNFTRHSSIFFFDVKHSSILKMKNGHLFLHLLITWSSTTNSWVRQIALYDLFVLILLLNYMSSI